MAEHLIPVPPILSGRWDQWTREVAWSLNPEMTTYRFTSPAGEVEYLKVATSQWRPPLEHERARMVWAAEFLPVPVVLDHHHDEATQWLITAGLPGVSGVDPELLGSPRRLVVRLAEALRVVHDTPIASCPFDFRLDGALGLAQSRVEQGLVDPERDFHDEYRHLSAEQALERLIATRPPEEDPVVCHGDYCPPNIVFEVEGLSGFVDLAELGVADRWWDLAIATWSVGWNMGVQYEPLFLEAYGAPFDPDRTAYYRLLYDVVS